MLHKCKLSRRDQRCGAVGGGLQRVVVVRRGEAAWIDAKFREGASRSEVAWQLACRSLRSPSPTSQSSAHVAVVVSRPHYPTPSFQIATCSKTDSCSKWGLRQQSSAPVGTAAALCQHPSWQEGLCSTRRLSQGQQLSQQGAVSVTAASGFECNYASA